MITIGVQGKQGSFCEEAAYLFAKQQKLIKFEIEYLISSKNVLAAINKNNIHYGILAIENARGGIVLESIFALAEYSCHITDMFHIKINQNLLTLPGISTQEISAIHSHRQALLQCRDFLADNFWGCPLIEEVDTAEAARRLISGDLTETAAVIANKACAKLYNLEILEQNIHDLKNNLTLFLVVTNKILK